MSWGVQAIGKRDAVRNGIATQFATSGKCTEPEESLRQAAAVLIDKALEAISPIYVVKVAASGSQGMKDYSKPENGVFNQLSITVEPQHGFLE